MRFSGVEMDLPASLDMGLENTSGLRRILLLRQTTTTSTCLNRPDGYRAFAALAMLLELFLQ